MSFVGVDIGASSTRYVSNSGEINVLPNGMTHLPDDNESRVTIDTPDIESCLEVKIVKGEPEQKTINDTADRDYFPANVLVGLMAEKYTGIPTRPSTQEVKCRQRNNFISAILACAVSKVKYGLTDSLDLYVAVPPSETFGGVAEAEFRARLIGTYTVTFPKYAGGVTVQFAVRNVYVYPESVMATTSFLFDMSGRIREDARGLLSGTILSLDIGASTTDMVIVKKGKFMDSSGRTIHYGGNTARERLNNLLSIKYGTDYSSEEGDTIMAEGRIASGISYEDVSAEVSEAKQILANMLISNIENYFDTQQLPVRSINAIIVSGGGSLQSQYVNDEGIVVKTAEPMSHFITQRILELSKNTLVLSYGADARYANVKGLYIKAKLDELKAQQQAATAQAVQPPTQQVQVAPQPQPQPVQAAAPQPVQAAPQPTEATQAEATQADATQTGAPVQQ